MFRSIYWKVTVPFALLVMLSMGILGTFMVRTVRSTQLDQLSSQLFNEARLIAAESKSYFTDPTQYARLDQIAKTTGKSIGTRITLITKDGVVRGDTDNEPSILENHAARPEVIAALTNERGQATRYSATLHENMMYVAVPVTDNGTVLGITRVALPLTAVERSVNSAVMTLSWGLGAATLFTILAAAIVIRMITRPVRQLTKAAQRISSGQLGEQLHVQTNDEIGRLGRAFNEMSSSLKNMMDAVSEERTKLATVMAEITDGVIMVDPESRMLLANRASETFFNFNEGKAKGKSLIEVIRDHEINESLNNCLNTSRIQTVHLDTAAGRFLRVIAVPLVSRKMSGALLVFQDLTGMRTLQLTRREFIGNVSHELRTPLAAIKAIVETLQDGAIDDKEVADDFLAKIDSEVDGMVQMVSEVIELSRIETGKVKLNIAPVELNLLVQETIAHLTPQAERKEITFLTQLADVPVVMADKDRVAQVIRNILHNAVKFTPGKGKITISTGTKGDSVITRISDTGMGISKTDLPHIFERFFKADRSRSSGGSGLGLAIARHIIQVHGGSIWVESEEGKGSTFNFTLPLG